MGRLRIFLIIAVIIVVVALVAFVLLSVWPVPARRYGSGVPWGLRSSVTLRAATALSATL